MAIVKTKILYIYCDGGLANRINCLANGLFIANKFKVDYQVFWPINRYCASEITNIFDVAFQTSNYGKEYFKTVKNLPILAEDNFIGASNELFVNPSILFSKKALFFKINQLLKSCDSMLIFYPRPLPQVYSDAIQEIRRIRFTEAIRARTQDEKSKLGLNKAYWGLHLRGTDARSSWLYYKIWRAIAHILPGRVLVVSDDQQILDYFNVSQKILKRQDIALPGKYSDNLEFNAPLIDENQQVLPYNIQRSSQSIFDATVDLLLLADSKTLFTSRSTFLELAINLSRHSSSILSHLFTLLARVRILKNLLRRSTM